MKTFLIILTLFNLGVFANIHEIIKDHMRNCAKKLNIYTSEFDTAIETYSIKHLMTEDQNDCFLACYLSQESLDAYESLKKIVKSEIYYAANLKPWRRIVDRINICYAQEEDDCKFVKCLKFDSPPFADLLQVPYK